jgi:hypothetical protein
MLLVRCISKTSILVKQYIALLHIRENKMKGMEECDFLVHWINPQKSIKKFYLFHRNKFTEWVYALATAMC